jgi:hypothetical protein
MHRRVRRSCRERPTFSQRGRHLSWKQLFPHGTISNDPKKLSHLNAAVEKRKQGVSEEQPCEGTVPCGTR